MERTKDLFMLMREAEVNTNNFYLLKKKYKKALSNL